MDSGDDGSTDGMYFETDTGVVSVQRYFVHLECYKPLDDHPFAKEWFNTSKLTPLERRKFDNWLWLEMPILDKVALSWPTTRLFLLLDDIPLDIRHLLAAKYVKTPKPDLEGPNPQKRKATTKKKAGGPTKRKKRF